ncbi:MAG: flotillin family protein [Deltaproteobacteria bacterium]|nr:flotillin family protein [Deltaproteobacteria bacterium]
MGGILAVLVIAFFALITLIIIVKNMLYICQPNEVLVFSGARRRMGNRVVGYKIIKGGRGIRIPLFETVDRVDLTNMIINVSVTNAYSKGGIPLTVQGVANIKIAGEEPLLNNALERFLARSRAEIGKIAKETLEGNLRGVLATLTPEQVNEDKISFEKSLLEQAEHDLSKLGLVLDTLTIQNISDEVGYLASIGRMRGAEVRKDARIAEARAKADAAETRARNLETVSLAQINAEVKKLEVMTGKRIADAQTKVTARVADAQGEVRARVAQATGELEMQKARIEQVRRRLEADVIQPAEAKRRAAEEKAKADAAKIQEEGRATAEALRAVSDTWKKAGPNARDVFLFQKLESLITKVVSTIQQPKIDKITVTGQTNGGTSLAAQLAIAVEQIRAATGVDVTKMLPESATRRGSSAS